MLRGLLPAVAFVTSVTVTSVTAACYAQPRTVRATPQEQPNVVPRTLCASVDRVLSDVPNKFRNIQGRPVDGAMDGVKWDARVRICDTIPSYIVYGGGIWTDYFASLFYSSNKAAVANAYVQYRDALSRCLAGKGYVGEVSGRNHFWLVDAQVFKYRVMDEDLTVDISMPTITLEFDSTHGQSTHPKLYWIMLDVWGMENNR